VKRVPAGSVRFGAGDNLFDAGSARFGAGDDLPPAVSDCVDAVAMILHPHRGRSGQADDLLARVRDLGLGEGLAQGGWSEGLLALHFAATMLAHADPAVAWQGLLEVCAGFAGAGQHPWPVPLPPDATGVRSWGVWVPLGAPQALAQPAGLDSGFRLASALPLAGFPGGTVITLVAAAELPPVPGCARLHLEAVIVTLFGLLNGMCQRLVEEAFRHSRQRTSAGRPLWQHQAVGLRLGELAAGQQALAHYLEAGLRSAAPAPPGADYPVATAIDVARHCLQIAGAHGYVEGLPIRRLVEQVSTVGAVLHLHRAAADRRGGRRQRHEAVSARSDAPPIIER
jgi:hypothetical protein